MRGYAALLSTLIICGILTALAFQAGTGAYLARLSALETEYAAAAQSNAYSCAQIVLFELSADLTYRPQNEGDYVQLSSSEGCRIESVTLQNEQFTTIVTGSHRGFIATLEIILIKRPGSRPPFTIISFRKI